jgi:1,4-dihydroxy-2-naphthoyl-CoA hydrolase
MAFVYRRIVRFQDTDAAGVVYFANVLSICHEAYEASLAAAEIDLNEFFRSEALAVPIVHAEADYFQPMFCGRDYAIEVMPTALGADKFKIQYRIWQVDQESDGSLGLLPSQPPEQLLIGRAATVHLCIHPQTRSRQALPVTLQDWLAVTQNPV